CGGGEKNSPPPLTGSPVRETAKHSKYGATGLPALVANAKLEMIQRSAPASQTTTGSPKFWLSHALPMLPWPISVSKLKAATCTPSLLRKMPTDVLTV